jgi:hypothetical protein
MVNSTWSVNLLAGALESYAPDPANCILSPGEGADRNPSATGLGGPYLAYSSIKGCRLE